MILNMQVNEAFPATRTDDMREFMLVLRQALLMIVRWIEVSALTGPALTTIKIHTLPDITTPAHRNGLAFSLLAAPRMTKPHHTREALPRPTIAGTHPHHIIYPY